MSRAISAPRQVRRGELGDRHPVGGNPQHRHISGAIAPRERRGDRAPVTEGHGDGFVTPYRVIGGHNDPRPPEHGARRDAGAGVHGDDARGGALDRRGQIIR